MISLGYTPRRAALSLSHSLRVFHAHACRSTSVFGGNIRAEKGEKKVQFWSKETVKDSASRIGSTDV